MSAKHSVGVLTLTFSVPPKYPNSRVQRVVDRHNELVTEAMHFLDCGRRNYSFLLNDVSINVVCGNALRHLEAVLLVTRRPQCNAADTLEVDLVAAYNDHFKFALEEDIVQFVQESLRAHMVPVVLRTVPAKHLGHAIGPAGNTIAMVGKGASLIWSPEQPTKGTYAIYLPKPQVTQLAKLKANKLIDDIETMR